MQYSRYSWNLHDELPGNNFISLNSSNLSRTRALFRSAGKNQNSLRNSGECERLVILDARVMEHWRGGEGDLCSYNRITFKYLTFLQVQGLTQTKPTLFSFLTIPVLEDYINTPPGSGSAVQCCRLRTGGLCPLVWCWLPAGPGER